MLNDWINEVSKHKQLLFVFFRKLHNFFLTLGRMFDFFFFCQFSRLYWPNAHPASSCHCWHCAQRRWKFRGSFMTESDEYLCPLTVPFHCYIITPEEREEIERDKQLSSYSRSFVQDARRSKCINMLNNELNPRSSCLFQMNQTSLFWIIHYM